MAPTRIISGLVLFSTLATASVFADDGQRNRQRGDRRGERTEERRGGRETARAVPRSPQAGRSYDGRRDDNRRYDNGRRYDNARRYDSGRRYDNDRRYTDRRVYVRPNYGNRGSYRSRTVIVPRYVRPRIVTVVPYRPYYYRPSLGLGLYYGASGAYPYGHTPRGYYNPLPGRAYGGVRITDAPHEAQVFADGYYVGIVDDFDGVFQHVNLEAGEHRIEIRAPGDEAVSFDIFVQPGRTMTLRADPY